MPVSAVNGKLVGNKVYYNVKPYDAVGLYLDYTKGDETDVTVNVLVKDEKGPDKEYPLRNRNLDPVSFTFTESARACVPVEFPGSADTLVVEVSFKDSGAGEGTVEVYLNVSSVYK